MQTLETKNKIYQLDEEEHLVNPDHWDKDFAEALAPKLGIPSLTASHWNVLDYIRSTYTNTGTIPIVFKTCKVQNLKVKELERLFPTGYQRGACKLAGVPSLVNGVCCTPADNGKSPVSRVPANKRVYRLNIQGFLIDPNEWDEEWAVCKAHELEIDGPLNEKHWKVIRFLRSEYEKQNGIPTLYATCEEVGIDVDELGELFPSGYHRGAAKIAGLNMAAKVPIEEAPAPVSAKA